MPATVGAGQFDTAVADLEPWWTDAAPLIVKPATGVGADGQHFALDGLVNVQFRCPKIGRGDTRPLMTTVTTKKPRDPVT